MVEITVDPNSHAISCLYQKVKEKALKSSSLKDVPKETFIISVSQVVNENLRINPATVNNIETLQFKSGQQVPMDFYIHMGVADSRIVALLSQALIGRLMEEGHLSNDAAKDLVAKAG